MIKIKKLLNFSQDEREIFGSSALDGGLMCNELSVLALL